jgi:hypothetical protein
MNPIRERLLLERRQFLTSCAGGIGGAALLSLLSGERGALGASARPGPTAKAKNCIFFFMEGGFSQFDLFSYKPKLNELHGQRPPESLLVGKRFAFLRKETAVLWGTDPSRTFTRHGQSGMMFSNLLPNLSRHADRICLIQSVFTNQFNHHPAQLVLQTGHNLDGHPSLGSWLLYGLGSENKNLPGYVALNSSQYLSGAETLWQNGFLPPEVGGVLFQSGESPILDLAPQAGLSHTSERRALDSLGRLNEIRRQKMMDSQIAARVANYELAFRMQAEAPALIDLSWESPATLARYGVDRPDLDGTPDNQKGGFSKFARQCLLARRMVERGVRFVNVFAGSWDAHADLNLRVANLSAIVDQPVAALIEDLNARGMLDETLVVFATEFGRTPLGENFRGDNRVTGRDHHPDAFSVFMVGGGVKGGLTYGETDEIGWTTTKDAVDVADFHATILGLFGLDHKQLSYPYQGVNQRLTPLTRQARIVDALIA